MITLDERLDKQLERVNAMIARLEQVIAKAELLVDAGEKMVAEVSATVQTLKAYLDQDGTTAK
jgi:hypothetical protein